MRLPSGEGAASIKNADGTPMSIFLCVPVAASTSHKPGFQPPPSIGAEGPNGNIGGYKDIWLVTPGSQWRKLPMTYGGVRLIGPCCVSYIHTCSPWSRVPSIARNSPSGESCMDNTLSDSRSPKPSVKCATGTGGSRG